MSKKDCLDQAKEFKNLAMPDGIISLGEQHYLFVASYYYFAAESFKGATECLEKFLKITISFRAKPDTIKELEEIIKYLKNEEISRKAHSLIFDPFARSMNEDMSYYRKLISREFRDSKIGEVFYNYLNYDPEFKEYVMDAHTLLRKK